MNLDTLSALDAPIDEDIPSIEGVEINEAPDDEKETNEPVKKEAPQIDPQQLENNISDKVIGKLMSLADARQPANAMQASPLQNEIAKLKQQGVPQEAIDNFLNLQIATHQELTARQQEQAKQVFVASYREGLRETASEALLEVAAGIKLIASNGGLRSDLVEQMGLAVMSNPKYSDVRNAIDSFKPVGKNRLKEVAAEIADKWCNENGLTKPKAGLDIKSSKPVADDSNFDVKNLSKAAAQIYYLTLKTTNDQKKARRRALSM